MALYLREYLHQRRWTLGLAAVIIFLTTLPALIGFAVQGEAYRFTGFVFGVEDVNSYIAKMLSGQAGAWLFRTPYTPLPQRGVLLFLPYLLLGKLAAPPALHEQLVSLYHLLRLLAVALATLATYDFLAVLLLEERWRRWGTVLITLGGGFGWVLVLLGQDFWLGSLPLDFYSPETFGFLGLYGFPHLGLARAALLWALVAYSHLLWPSPGSAAPLKKAVPLSAWWLLAGLMQPLTALVIGLVLGLHLGVQGVVVLRQRSAEQLQGWLRTMSLVILAGLLPGGYVLYNAIALWSDPFLQQWTAQNIIRSPHPLHYLVAYGLILPFAWLGGRIALQLTQKERRVWGWLLVGWVALFPLLAYLPVNLQRRLPEGVWAAWVALAMLAFEGRSGGEQAAPAEEAPGRKNWHALWLGFAFPSTLLLLIGGCLSASRPNMPIFRPAEEVAGFEFLAQNAAPGQVVLSAYETGNALPAWAPLRVVIGHGPESARLEELRPQVAAFYAECTADDQRLALLRQYQVAYVFWGPAERRLGDWYPERATYLRRVFQQGDYSIYEVLPLTP